MNPKRALATLACLTLAGTWSGAEGAQASGDQQPQERRELLEILKRAKPAPVTPGPKHSAAESAAPEQRGVVGFDPSTGKQTILPRSDAARISGAALAAPAKIRGAPSAQDELENAHGQFVGLPSAASRPTPVLDTHNQPWNTVFKLLMRFNVSGTDYFYVCSASSSGSFHLLTAGHCIYSWDPNDDGDTSDARWASEIWAWAGQTDLVNPFADPDHPYGVAKMVYARSYTGWVNSRNFDHDWGVITLDRRVGDHTGWMGRESDTPVNSLNFTGYPTETPHVPPDNLLQYHGFDLNNVTGYTSGRIEMDAFIYGGHSGGPAWRFDPSTNGRWIQGVNSTSDRAGSAEETLLTSGKFSDLNSWMSTDETARPPTARPNLIEYVFDLNAKALLTNTAHQGDSFDIEYNVMNAGFAGSGAITVDFYLSSNLTVSTFDTLIESRVLSELNAFSFHNPTTTLTVPLDQPLGVYYVGWIMSGAVAEYPTTLMCSGTPCDNVVVIANQTLNVLAVARCGDGTIAPGEQCDDGNLQDGDCCSSTCVIEDPSTCVPPCEGVSGPHLLSPVFMRARFRDRDGDGKLERWVTSRRIRNGDFNLHTGQSVDPSTEEVRITFTENDGSNGRRLLAHFQISPNQWDKCKTVAGTDDERCRLRDRTETKSDPDGVGLVLIREKGTKVRYKFRGKLKARIEKPSQELIRVCVHIGDDAGTGMLKCVSKKASRRSFKCNSVN